MHSFERAMVVVMFLLPAISAKSGEPVYVTPNFVFYSDLNTNLNDALINTGVDRKFDRPEMFRSANEAACVDDLPSSAHAGWNRAVDYYQEIVSPASFMDRPQYTLRMHLAGDHREIMDDRSQQYIGISNGFLQAAMPMYMNCRWPEQDQKNRTWIRDTLALLSEFEEPVARRLEQLYQVQWTRKPIRADIVNTVSWSGANSLITDPGSGHLLISIEYQGHERLEIVFHEASHLLMGRNDPVWRALDQAAEDIGIKLPDGLWHVVLFFTTGHTVKTVLAEAGVEDYVPMIYGIYPRSPWGRFQEAMEATWPAYLEGEKTLDEATASLLNAVRELE